MLDKLFEFQMFDKGSYYIIDSQTLKRVEAVCKKLVSENPEFKETIKTLIKSLLMLDEIDEIREIDNIGDEDMIHIAFQIREDIEAIEELNEKILGNGHYSSKDKDSVTLNEMLENVGVKLSKKKRK